MNYNLENLETQSMLREQKNLKALLIALFPFMLVVLIMTPRLISAQFGLLDDGTMLLKVQRILQGDVSMSNDLQAGRFRPFYWYYFCVIYALAGMRPFWFYIGHLILFIILLIQIRTVMKNMGAAPLQILLSSLVFIFTIPIIENFYTLSKGEPLQLIFILAAVLNYQKADRRIKFWRALLIFLCIVSAIFVKETALTMAPLGTAWILYLLSKHQHVTKTQKQNALIFVIMIITAVGFYFLIRGIWGATPLTGGTYTERYSLSIETILTNIFRWMTLLAFYFHYLIPLILAFALLRVKKAFPRTQLDHNLFFWATWVIFWIISLIPWGYAEAYYLLPFGLGIAIIIGLTSPMIIKIPWKYQDFTAIKILLIVAGVLFLATLPNYRTHASAQLAIDRANHQMLIFVKDNTPENGKVFIGLETEKEYVQNIKLFLNDHYGRSDITYNYVSVKTLERLHWYPDALLILPHVVNLPNLLPRTGVDETFTMAWAEIIMRTMEDRLKKLQTFHQSFKLSNFNLPIVTCSTIGEAGFCISPDPIFDMRTFTYGWNVQKIKQKEN